MYALKPLNDLVVERAGEGEFVGRRAAPHGFHREEIAALFGDLVTRFVLPCVQQRVGDDALLLHADLADDQVGQAGVGAAVGPDRVRGRLVGLLLVRAFEGFGLRFFRFLLLLFFCVLGVFFFFLLGFYLCFLRFLLFKDMSLMD